MPDVEGPRNVRRRNHDRECLSPKTRLRTEQPGRVPRRQARGLDGLRVVRLGVLGLLAHYKRSEASAASSERSLFVNVTWPKIGWFLKRSTRFVRPFEAASR